MIVVAVAGGSGGVGRTIVEELMRSEKYSVVVLTRSGRKQESDDAGPRREQITYDDIDATAKTLSDLDIHTIISTISIDSEATSQAQLNLVAAAGKSKCVTRFMPSEFGLVNRNELLELDPTVQYWIDAANALEKSSLRYTRIVNGFFMDYWGMPNIKTNLSPFTWAVDVLNCKAAIPGDGEQFISITYSLDMARFVVKLLELDDWPEFSVVVGEDVTFNQLVRLAESIRGSKFEVSYDSEENLKGGKVTMLSNSTSQELVDLVVLFGRYVVEGRLLMPREHRLNEVFGDLCPMSLEPFLKQAWGKR